MPGGDLSRENARHECGTLWCVRGTVVRTLHGSMGSTLEPPWRLFHVHVSPRVRYTDIFLYVCVRTCVRIRRAPVAHPRVHVGVFLFVCVQRERGWIEGNWKDEGRRIEREETGKREERERERSWRVDGKIIRAVDGRKLEGQREGSRGGE